MVESIPTMRAGHGCFKLTASLILLLCAVDPDKSIDEHQGQLAVLAALTTCGDTPPPMCM